MDNNYGFFNPDVAGQLAAIARENGFFLKEHNADYLDEESLKIHPVLGISSLNAAPEFGVTETKVLMRLSYLVPSGELFRRTLSEKVFSDNRWQKWLPADLKDIKPVELWKDPALAYKATASCGHYYLDQPDVAILNQKASYPENPDKIYISACSLRWNW